MELAMCMVMRTTALVLVFIGVGAGPLAAQQVPPPGGYPPPPPGPSSVVNPRAAPPPPPPVTAQVQEEPPPPPSSYQQGELVSAGHRFFGEVSRGLAQIIEKAISNWGQPNGYILGQEASGAFVAGLRYGEGTLYTRNAGDLRVFWQGPSVGFDMGGEGARTMMLVYNLPRTSAVYQRFGGIDGSAYFIGGFGMTALAADNIVVVPIRSGVGLRLGANVGYLKFTSSPTWNPF
jgi:hypothetical protein